MAAPETTSAARIVAILAAQTGITPAVTGLAAARVSQGMDNLKPDDDFFAGLLTTGAWAHVQIPVVGENDQQGFYSYEIPIHIWHGYAKGVDLSFATILDINFAIRSALNCAANWTTTGHGPQPASISCEKAVQDSENVNGEYVEFVITARFFGALAGAV